MNPETGTFHDLLELKEKFGTDDGEEAVRRAKKAGWPTFEIGEEIEIKGQPFRLELITKNNRLILKPRRLTAK